MEIPYFLTYKILSEVGLVHSNNIKPLDFDKAVVDLLNGGGGKDMHLVLIEVMGR